MNPPIPFADLQADLMDHWSQYREAMYRVMRSGHFILGPEVEAFESEVAAYLGSGPAVGVNSGTDALVIGLRALGVGPGDEVITTPLTFFATAEAISMVGASPVFVDVDPRTLNLDPALVARAVTPRTRAILPVHLFGQAADMEALLALGREHGLFVVEDVAQACGGSALGHRLGTLGDVGAFSFFPSKTLGAFGDAGLLVARDPAVAERARMLRAHGSRRKYYNEEVGYNSRLDALQAAILRAKLPRLDAANRGRCEAARRYDALVDGLTGVTPVFCVDPDRHVYNYYTVRIAGGRRDTIQKGLADRGVGTMVYYPVPMHRLPMYAAGAPSLPHAEKAVDEVISLPLWPTIDDATQRIVVDALRDVLAAQ